MTRRMMQRPSCAKAKSSQWQDWTKSKKSRVGDKDDDDDDHKDDCFDEEQVSSELTDADLEKPITAQQRHVFTKALANLPGLPAEVEEQWKLAKAGKPKDRARVINACVPRDVTYSSHFDVRDMIINTSNKYFKRSTCDKTKEGKSRTELEVMWGFGDLD